MMSPCPVEKWIFVLRYWSIVFCFVLFVVVVDFFYTNYFQTFLLGPGGFGILTCPMQSLLELA